MTPVIEGAPLSLTLNLVIVDFPSAILKISREPLTVPQSVVDGPAKIKEQQEASGLHPNRQGAGLRLLYSSGRLHRTLSIRGHNIRTEN